MVLSGAQTLVQQDYGNALPNSFGIRHLAPGTIGWATGCRRAKQEHCNNLPMEKRLPEPQIAMLTCQLVSTHQNQAVL